MAKKKVATLAKGAHGKRLLTVYLWDDQYTRLQALARRVGRPMTKVVRYLIADALANAALLPPDADLDLYNLLNRKPTA